VNLTDLKKEPCCDKVGMADWSQMSTHTTVHLIAILFH